MAFDREIPNDALGYVEPDEQDDMPGDDADEPRNSGDEPTGDSADSAPAI